MPARSSYAPGTPSWVDVQTTDPAAAKTFYAALFGWEYADNPVEGTDAVYSMAEKNGQPVAAISAQQPEQVKMGIPPLWNTYITVDDADATAGKVEGAGGAVLAPAFDVMDAGRMAVLADPTGAVFMVWQAKEHPGAALVNEPGTLCWNELMTTDLDTALPFYGDVLGWTFDDFGDPATTYKICKVGDDGVAGAQPPPMEGIPPSWAVYFTVDDADAIVERAKVGGATILVEPFDIPIGRIAAIQDPQGAVFSITQLAEPAVG